MMKTLTNFGIVLVVLAMVTSSAFATNYYEGPDWGTWFDAGNWDDGAIPDCDDGERVQIDDGLNVKIDQSCSIGPASNDSRLIIRDGGLLIGTASVRACLTVCGELRTADDKGRNSATLNVYDGTMVVKSSSQDFANDGNTNVNVSAGSSLIFEKKLRISQSGEDNSVIRFDIAGYMSVGQRFEIEKGTTTINLTGNGTFYQGDTGRYSTQDVGLVIVNINTVAGDTGHALYHQDGGDVELGKDENKCKKIASAIINVFGNGTWDGEGRDFEFKKDDQILNITIKDNGTFIADDLEEDGGDPTINLSVDGAGASADIDNVDLYKGTIKVTNGALLDLGDLVVGDSGDDAQVTIDSSRMNVDELEFGDTNGGQWIDILGSGELVIRNADDKDAWDDIQDLIDDGLIMTSQEGMVVVWDYGISHDGKLTVKIVMPVTIDIKPGTCPNPLRVNFIGQGVFSVVIVGSDALDVLDVDVATITLQGVSPVRSNEKDLSTIGAEVCGCTTLGPDGKLDLELKFKRADVLEALEESVGDLSLIDHRSQVALTLDGNLQSDPDVAIQGSDCFTILNRGAIKPKK